MMARTAAILCFAVAFVGCSRLPWTRGEPGDPDVLQFRLVAEEAGPDTEMMPLSTGGKEESLHVEKEVLLNAADVRSVHVDQVGAEGRRGIALAFTDEGGKTFGQVTQANVGRRLAIVVQGKVLSAPVIRCAIRDRAQIAGNFTMAEARGLAETIRAAVGQ
jgi:preprotein translocase subunit SecD